MKHCIIYSIFAYAWMTSTLLATTLIDTSYKSEIPHPIKVHLRYSIYYEDFIAGSLQQFRQYSIGKKEFHNNDIKTYKNSQFAALKARKVQSILVADINNDGQVSKKEVVMYIKRQNRLHKNENNLISQWMRPDKNNDEIISYNEMRSLEQSDVKRIDGEIAQIESLFNFDSNKDGILTLDEFKHGVKSTFKLFDTDKNGELSESEKQKIFYDAYGGTSEVIKSYPLDKAAELHVVGIYEGYTKSEGKTHGPRASIYVSRPNQNLVLFLTSYDVVKWEIKADDKTKISNIFISSHKTSPASEVWLNSKKYSAAINLPSAVTTYKKEGADFRKSLEYISKVFKRKSIHSFHGRYTAPQEPFEITQIEHDTELKKDRLIPASADKVPSVTFRAMIDSQYGIFNATGKLIKELPPVLSGAAYIESLKQYYAIGDNGIKAMNADGKVVKEIPVSLDVPPFSWPMGIAYNKKTKQLAITSLGGEGFLYHYDLKTQKWTAFSQNNQDYMNLNFDSVTNYYVASTSFGPTAINFIRGNGRLVKQEKLDPKVFPGLMDFSDPENGHPPVFEIIPSKDYYVIVLKTGNFGKSNGSAQRIYLYNRETKSAMLTYVAH